MTDHDDIDAAASGDDDAGLPPDVVALLSRQEMWDDPPAGLEDAIVAMIAAEATVRPVAEEAPARTAPRTVRAPTRSARVLALVAAVVVLVAGALGAFLLVDGDSGDDGGFVVALGGTELAPTASATADIESTPLGVKIVLDVEGLPGAPPGTYYEAWLRSDDDGVSAGTFHLRGGDGAIELWCGVDDESYSRITVTLQEEGGGTESSGRVVLRGDW